MVAAVSAAVINCDDVKPGVLPPQWQAGDTGNDAPRWMVEADEPALAGIGCITPIAICARPRPQRPPRGGVRRQT